MPVLVIAAQRDGQLNQIVLGGFADTANNRVVLHPHRHLVLPSFGWLDVDVTSPYPFDKLNPTAVRCAYINPRPESGRSGPHIDPDGVFVGRVNSEPLFVPE